MHNNDLHCLFIGERSGVYSDLLNVMDSFDLNIRATFVEPEKKQVISALKKQRVASLIFISDMVLFSVEVLSDLVWQYASDVIVVIVTEKTVSTSLKVPFHNTQFSKLHVDKDNQATQLHLQYLIQAIRAKSDFRRCKSLLGISEKRCQWLVESSNEAIAFISRDLHLYANAAYLGLFEIKSIHEVPAISVKKLIVDDEHPLFVKFVKKQMLSRDLNCSLTMSFRKTNGKTFRATIHIIPSVFKGQKCLQLWVHPHLKYEENLDDRGAKSTNTAKISRCKKVTPASMLKDIIKSKESTLLAQKLVEMKPNENNGEKNAPHQMLSLKVPVAQRSGVDDLLSKSGGVNLQVKRQIFWDKVKLTQLIQLLLVKKKPEMILFIRLSKASVVEKSFFEWFFPGLRRAGDKASSMSFLLSSQCEENHIKSFMIFVNELRLSNCQIALDDFTASEQSLRLLKEVSPEYVRLSQDWIKKLEGNKKRELGLASFIRQLEAKNIKVIAPCGFSADMKQIFALSGVSFCQEKQ